MDFDTLQRLVEGQYDSDSKEFAFMPAPYKSADIVKLCSDQFEQDQWKLTGASAPVSDTGAGTITLDGTAASLAGQDDVAVTMTFFLESGDAQMLVTVDLGGGWTFADTFPELKGTVFENVGFSTGKAPVYAFASAKFVDKSRESSAFAVGQNFFAHIVPDGGVFTYLKDIIGSFSVGTLAGPVDIIDDGPNMNLVLNLGIVATLVDKFPILKDTLTLAMISEFSDSEGSVTGLELSTHFAFGHNTGLKVAAVLNPWVAGSIQFIGTFENIALPSFSQFAAEFEALIGANDLGSSLPAEYGDNSGLALQTISMGLSTKDWKPSSIGLEIGTPKGDPGWPLGHVATVEQVKITAQIENPFAKDGSRSLQVKVLGEVSIPTSGEPVEMVADAEATFKKGTSGEYSVSACLAPGSDLTIPLGDILGTYVPAAKDAPDIALGDLGFEFDFKKPKNHYGFHAGLDENKPATFKFGGTEVLELKSGSFRIENESRDGKPGGEIKGALKIFSIDTDFAYVMPGDFQVTAHFPAFNIDTGKIITDLAAPRWTAPDWMPVIPFPKTDLYLAHMASTKTDTIALRSEPSFGTIVLQVLKVNTSWGFAAALDLNVQKIATFDGLSMLSGMDDYFKVKDLLFVFSSAAMPNGFQFPPKTAFPKATGKIVSFPNWAGAIKVGFYFYGSMQLNLEQKTNIKMVQDMFGLPQELDFNLLVFIGLDPLKDAQAQAMMSGTIDIGGKNFAKIEGAIGLMMKSGIPEFFVDGAITTTIHDDSGAKTIVSKKDPDRDHDLTAALAFELTDNAAYLSASMIGQVTFGPITLADLVLAVGIDFEGIPSLGFACSITLEAYGTSYDSSIAFFFDSGNPQNSLFAGSVSDIHMGQVLTTLVGVITGGDKPPQWMVDLLNGIALEGTQKFSLPMSAKKMLQDRNYSGLSEAFNTALTKASQPRIGAFTQSTTMTVDDRSGGIPADGWYITNYPSCGVIQHYEMHLGEEDVSVNREAQVYYCMPPGGGSVTLGPPNHGLTFNSGIYVDGVLKVFMLELEALVDVHPNKGLRADVELKHAIEILKIPDSDLVFLAIRSTQDPKKGPQFSLATFSEGGVSPHFKLDGEIEFLGLTASAYINISDEGLHVDIGLHAGDKSLGADFAVKADFDSVTDFDFAIAANAHIDDPHFKLFSIDMGTIPLSLSFEAGLSFVAKDGVLSFVLDAAHFTFEGHRFGLPKLTLSVRTDKLSDIPGILYDAAKQAIWDFLSDVAHWLEWVGKKIIEGVEDIGKVLEDVFHAISSVWSNDKRIVVAIHESFSQSEAFNVTITPEKPTAGVTQEMIDSARAWANDELEHLVATNMILTVRETSPDDLADFKVSALSDITETYELQENQTWIMTPHGALPSLAAMGFENPVEDPRFFSTVEEDRNFQLALSISGDFNQDLQMVTATVRYAEKTIGNPYTFTSKVVHNFQAPWSSGVGVNFEVKYEVTYLNGGTVSSPWIKQRGTEVSLLMPVQS